MQTILSAVAIAFLACLPLSSALPTNVTVREVQPPFSVSQSVVDAAVTCSRGDGKSPGGTVLLVHGTVSTAAESWAVGPYNVILPTMEPGFDICWVDLPKKALVDAQISAEYVAQAVLSLAKRSTTGKVSIIGHSQGAGFNPQWALTFFPSIRSYVAAYVALAPDFHGTLDSTFCKFLPTSICPQSIWQQAAGSHYIRAQNIDGYRALVPTTVIYTSTDEVVTPEVGLTYSSRLDGATIIGVQDLDICGPAKMLGHASMLIDPAPFALAYNALINGGNAIRSDFALTSCVSYPVPPSVDFGATVNLIESAYKDLASGFFPAETVSSAEPPLRKYVCDRYPDQGFSCA